AGDGTNYVIIFASELLQNAEYLLRMGLHPSEIAKGYGIALKKALDILDELVISQVSDLKDVSQISKITKTSIAPKEFGYQDFLGDLVAKAVVSVMPKNPENFNVENIRVVKILGGNILQSTIIPGLVLPREPESVVKSVTNVKLAMFSCPVDIGQTETKGTVLLHNAKEMINYTKGEEKIMEQARVGDLALHYLNQANILVIKIPSKFELRRLCKLTGATAMARLGAPTAEEIGSIDEITVEEVGNNRVTVLRNLPENSSSGKSTISTIVLRGATQNYLDDVERAVDDGVNVIKSLTKDSRLVAGATATEVELYTRLLKFADSNNSSQESTSFVGPYIGIDVEATNSKSGLLDAVNNNIVEPLGVKNWALRYATEAAITILQVDQIIMAKPAGGPKLPPKQGHWDDQD
ncbi:hypothetical protein BB560_005776, partial [Smittium megazygosporum]